MPRKRFRQTEEIPPEVHEVIEPEQDLAVKSSVTPYVITSDEWDDLWEAFHKRKDKEDGNRDVPRAALTAALQDHGQQPAGLVVKEHRAKVTCNREALWDFLRRLRMTYADWDRDLRLAKIKG